MVEPIQSWRDHDAGIPIPCRYTHHQFAEALLLLKEEKPARYLTYLMLVLNVSLALPLMMLDAVSIVFCLSTVICLLCSVRFFLRQRNQKKIINERTFWMVKTNVLDG